MPELILASVTICVAVFVFTYQFISKPSAINLRDEHKESKYAHTHVNKRTNLLLGCLLCAIVAFVITGKVLFAVLAIPLGFTVANWLNTRREKARQKLLQLQYVQVLSTLMTSMQGGGSPYQALEEAVPSLPRPSKDVFIEIVRGARTGSTYEEAVQAACEQTKWKELRSLEVVLSLYSKTGCNLVEVLKHLLKSVYEQNADKKYVEAVTSSIRTTAMFLSVLPFGLMAFARFMAPEFAAPLFNTTGGVITIISVVVMVFVGNRVIRKMLEKVLGIAS